MQIKVLGNMTERDFLNNIPAPPSTEIDSVDIRDFILHIKNRRARRICWLLIAEGLTKIQVARRFHATQKEIIGIARTYLDPLRETFGIERPVPDLTDQKENLTDRRKKGSTARRPDIQRGTAGNGPDLGDRPEGTTRDIFSPDCAGRTQFHTQTFFSQAIPETKNVKKSTKNKGKRTK